MVFDLDAWPKVWLRNFMLKNFFLAATNIVINSNKEKYAYSGYGRTFDGKCEVHRLEMVKFLVLIILHHVVLII